MTADLLTDTRPRRRAGARRLRRGAAPALVFALAGGGAAACAQDSDGTIAQTEVTRESGESEFAATAGYLSTVAEQSAAEPYRVEMDFTLRAGGEQIDVDNMLTGQIDGDRVSFHVDLSSLFEQTPGAGAAVDPARMTMDMVSDGDLIYIKAPMYGALSELDPGNVEETLGPIGDLAVIADQWGSVDPAALGTDADVGDLASQAGGQAGDPREFLRLVSEATEPHELGDDVIKSERVQGIGATVTFEQLIEAQGRDADGYMDQLGGGEIPPALMDEIMQMDVPVEVWIDAEDHVRQVSFAIDMGELLSTAGVDDPAAASAGFDMTMDFFDYGAEDIAIEAPEATVDVTDAFGALLAAG